MEDLPVDAAFAQFLPKLELHAHLTGSIKPQSLHSIWLYRRQIDASLHLPDPLEMLDKDKRWDINAFFPLFSEYIYTLICTPETITLSTNSVLYDFWADGVVYLELRTTPRSADSFSKLVYTETILDCIKGFEHRASMPTYLILSIDRRNTLQEALEVVDIAIRYHGEGVVGVDLCGDPSKGDISIFGPAFVMAKDAGLKITLHFAEVPTSSSLKELDTLLSFRPDRLGHVICTPQEIKTEVVRRGLGVEMCVSCNVQAGLTRGGVAGHHFGWWKDSNSPLALCTDDVGIFDSKLSNEYLLVAQHFGLDRNDLLNLCYAGIDIIFGSEEDKSSLRAKFSRIDLQPYQTECGLK